MRKTTKLIAVLSAAAMMSMFPGAGRISDDELDKSEKELGRMKAIIQSMTKGERLSGVQHLEEERKRLVLPGRRRKRNRQPAGGRVLCGQ